MARLWRLIRNEHARRVYEALKRAGITGTRMYEYVADIDDDAGHARSPPDGVAIESFPASQADSTAREAFAELYPDETVVVARVDGRIVGHLFVSVGREVYIKPLECDLGFEGAYVRRVFVDPEWRARGIATGLVAQSMELACEREVETAHALVALDNRPSQWMLEANGFERRRVHSYVRIFQLVHRDERLVTPR